MNSTTNPIWFCSEHGYSSLPNVCHFCGEETFPAYQVTIFDRTVVVGPYFGRVVDAACTDLSPRN